MASYWQLIKEIHLKSEIIIPMWLVTGGAGYIGRHVVRELTSSGNQVIVVDDGSSSDLSNFSESARLLKVDITDYENFNSKLKPFEFQGVIHLAGKKSVSESFAKPQIYMNVNVGGTRNVLRLIQERSINSLIFSSSASIYDATKVSHPKEGDPLGPISPYGKTKLIGERLIQDFARVNQIRHCSLRYFNVAGASSFELLDKSRNNLIPIIIDRIKSNKRPIIFGNDYQTIDGTCVRDFIHVSDIAKYHALAAQELTQRKMPEQINLGTGRGYSVLEVTQCALKAMNSNLIPIIDEKRVGDPANLVADISLASSIFDFKPNFTLKEIIESNL